MKRKPQPGVRLAGRERDHGCDGADVITEKKLDCKTCGLCCISPHEQLSFCEVSRIDIKRLGTWANGIIHKIVHGAIRARWVENKIGPLAGFEQCRCVALRGSVMHRVSCAIYAKRPEVCRHGVVRGGRTCVALRSAYERFVTSLKQST